MSHILLPLLLQVCLIFLNAVFACAEIAVISMNDAKLSQMASQGNRKAIRLSKLTKQPARFLATIQVAITLSGFLGSAFAAENFSDPIVAWLVSVGCPFSPATLNTVTVILITLVLSYFTLVFGELVPKRLAMKKPEELALGMSALIRFISILFAPLVSLLTASTNLILRMMGIDPDAEDSTVCEDDIKVLVDQGLESGILDDDENQMIKNIFEFDDLPVSEFLTHRTEVAILWADDSPADWEKVINDNRHSIYPVCSETVDEVIGVLNAKDYFRLPDRTDRKAIEAIIQPAFFVPETVKADLLFRKMRDGKNHFAVVLDEHGGMVGIVTIYDLVEQLVGDMETPDEPSEPPEIEKIGDDTWRVCGSAPMDDLAQELGMELPVEEYDTFGGYVFGQYGSVPDDHTTFEISTDEMEIKVTKIEDHKLESAVITPIRHATEDTDNDD